MKNVVLVGFPGSGKTTIGKQLATQLGLRFVDLDAAIEEKYHTTIPQLFNKYGEFVFRKCEYATLTQVLQDNNMLLSTGGGTPCFHDAMDVINQHSISIYIKLSEDTLFDRLKDSRKKRPLTQHLNDEELRRFVKETLSFRKDYYEKAQLTLSEMDVNDLSSITSTLFQRIRV